MRRFGLLMALVLPMVGVVAGNGVRHAAAAAAPEFVFADEVTVEDRTSVVEGFRLAQDFFRAAFEAEFRERVVFDVGPDPDAPSSASAWEHDVLIATDHQVWLESPSLWRVKAAVHEAFHVLQFEWSRGRDFRDWGPVWVLEGAAELVGWRAMIAKGLLIDGPITDSWIGATQTGWSSDVPLPQMEPLTMPPEVRCCLYEVAPLAVEQLVAGPGLASLRTYYEAIGDGTPWRDAFEAAFGQTVEDFYTTFETVRWQLVPAGHDLTVIARGTFVIEGIAEVAVVSVSSPITRGEQFALVGATAPGIACTMVFTSAGGKHLVTQPTHAGPDGTVFWLWSVRPKLANGMASATVDCGATPVTVGVEFR